MPTAELTQPIDLSILAAEPADEYHARAGEYLSSHQLLDFIACPWLYRKKQLGLIDEPESSAYLLGRAAHCRILEGRDAYEAQFAIGGPINPRTKKPFGKETKAFRDWCEGKPGVHASNTKLTTPEGYDQRLASPDIPSWIAPIFIEWADAVLYAHRDEQGDRKLLTEATNVILAKNRYGLPAELSLSWTSLMQAMNGSASTTSNTNSNSPDLRLAGDDTTTHPE